MAPPGVTSAAPFDSEDSGVEEDSIGSDLSILSSDDDRAGPSRSKRARRSTTHADSSAAAATHTSQLNKKKIGGAKKGRAWEGEFEHTWDSVREDDRGTLEGAVKGALLSGKSRRILRDTASIQRGIIRHVYLVIDLSTAMLEREFKSSWLDLTLQYAREFVTEFFDQNPISQMAILVTRDGTAERLSPLGGNPVDHLKALSNKKRLEPRGDPSLQNVLKMAQAGLNHLPPHGSREVIIILGSLTTCDPSNIHNTISEVKKDRIRVNLIGLSAEMKICRDIATATLGTYSVALDDLYLRQHLFEFVAPPATFAPSQSIQALGGPANNKIPAGSAADLMLMGFPRLLHAEFPSLCSCHSKLKPSGFQCPRCKSRICDVPTECRICGMTVVNAPQLARSYRHLFPVANYKVINIASDSNPPNCFSCSFPFPTGPSSLPSTLADLSVLGRYECPECENQFCLDCDKLIHDALGFCPGCS